MIDVAEFLGEVNLTGLLVVIEEAVDGRPNHVRGGCGDVGGISRCRGGHDEVDDVHRHGAIELAENRSVKPEPRGYGRRRRCDEVILKGVGGDGDGEEAVPLGEDVGLEVEDARDEGADAMDGGGLRP